MVNRLIDLFVSFLHLFRAWEIIDEYERGVRLRFGKLYNGALLPGFHWRIPFGVDKILTENVTRTTTALSPQALTTKDGVGVVVSGIVTWRICDIVKFLIKVEEAKEILADVTRGVIRQLVAAHTWDEISYKGEQFDDELFKKARTPAFQWGVEVLKVSLSDVAKCRSLRLLGTWTED